MILKNYFINIFRLVVIRKRYLSVHNNWVYSHIFGNIILNICIEKMRVKRTDLIFINNKIDFYKETSTTLI